MRSRDCPAPWTFCHRVAWLGRTDPTCKCHLHNGLRHSIVTRVTGPRLAFAAGMATRDFIDSAGERWLVWDTRPTTRVRLNPAFQAGWLTFECGDQLRRLAPTPPGWESLDDAELQRLCLTATPVGRRRTPPGAFETLREIRVAHRDEPRA